MHYARAFDYRDIEYTKKPFKFNNTKAGFMELHVWILDLKEKHEKDKGVPGMESTGHYWFNLGKFLQDNEMKPVLVNPRHEGNWGQVHETIIDHGYRPPHSEFTHLHVYEFIIENYTVERKCLH